MALKPMHVWCLLGVLIVGPPSVMAQDNNEDGPQELPQGTIYYWHDDSGQLHATDNLSSVPEAHQSEAKSRAGRLPGGEKTTIESSGSSWQPPPERSKKAAEPEEDKAYWQGLIESEKEARDNAKSRLEEVNSEIGRVNATRPPGFHQTLTDLNQEKTALEAEIKRATHELETGIPEKARRAGVPPGWLR